MRNRWLLAGCMIISLMAAGQYAKKLDSLHVRLAGQTDGVKRFDIYRNIAWTHIKAGDFRTAYFDTLFRVAAQLKNDSLVMQSYLAMADYLDFRNDARQVIEYALKALYIAEQHYPSEVPSIYNLFGSAYGDLKNYDVALRYLRKAVQLPQNRGNHLTNTLAQLTINFSEMGMADSALHYAQRLNERVMRNPDHNSKKFIALHLGTIYEQLNEPSLAESYYRRSIDTIHSAPIFNDAKAAGLYSRFLLQKGRLHEAKLYGLQGVAAARALRAKKPMLISSAVLQKVYHALNQPDSAYYFASLELAYRDSLFDQDNLNAVQSINFNETLREQEEAFRKAEEEVRRKHNLQYAAIALGLLGFLTAFLLLTQSVLVNQRVIRFLGILSLLLFFEFINLLLHPFIGGITHHSPLLMLLFLVSIAAFLIPLHHKLEHWVTHKMVEKNNKIRLAAAKKTIQQLEGSVTALPAEKRTDASER